MIQRIQSLYLFVAAVATGLIFLFPLGETIDQDAIYQLGVFGLEKIAEGQTTILFSTIALVILTGLSGALSLATIFMFKNRKLQVKLTQVGMLLSALLVAAIFYYVNEASSEIGAGAMMHYQLGIVMPIISLVFLILAVRSIKQDEELVRSADRLR